MSMFTVTGEVRNVFYQPGQLDKETGTLKPGSNKVQVLGEMPVNGGGSKEDLITLTIPEGMDFEPLKKRLVRFPLGFFSPAKGAITYFIPKGSKVEILDAVKSQVSVPAAVLANSPFNKS
jgi:hypothetical protein